MNTPESYFSPEQKEYLAKKVRELKNKSPLVLCVKSDSGDIAFIEAGTGFRINATWDFINQINQLFGSKAIRLKVDKTVPEVRKRTYFKKERAS